jgi:hypothetical protein
VIDLLGESDGALQVVCIHDADAYGTRIYQALKKATAVRPERKVEIVNLGLDPWEALDIGLEVEKVKAAGEKSRNEGQTGGSRNRGSRDATGQNEKGRSEKSEKRGGSSSRGGRGMTNGRDR